MPGPWIKIEYATIKKPEVRKIGRAIGVTRQHAFALCVEFWMWCDANLKDGQVMGCNLEDIDDIVDQEGFGEAMRQVGWITLEDDRYTITNFDKHLGQSAKNRAMGAIRQAKYQLRLDTIRAASEKRQNSVRKTSAD